MLNFLIFRETRTILEERKLRHRDVRLPTPGHSAGKQQRHTSHPSNLAPECVVFSVYNLNDLPLSWIQMQKKGMYVNETVRPAFKNKMTSYYIQN